MHYFSKTGIQSWLYRLMDLDTLFSWASLPCLLKKQLRYPVNESSQVKVTVFLTPAAELKMSDSFLLLILIGLDSGVCRSNTNKQHSYISLTLTGILTANWCIDTRYWSEVICSSLNSLFVQTLNKEKSL